MTGNRGVAEHAWGSVTSVNYDWPLPNAPPSSSKELDKMGRSPVQSRMSHSESQRNLCLHSVYKHKLLNSWQSTDWSAPVWSPNVWMCNFDWDSPRCVSYHCFSKPSYKHSPRVLAYSPEGVSCHFFQLYIMDVKNLSSGCWYTKFTALGLRSHDVS